jgi:hypothetical protein
VRIETVSVARNDPGIPLSAFKVSRFGDIDIVRYSKRSKSILVRLKSLCLVATIV